MIIKISSDFTDTPGHRYVDDGPYSGELFRDSLLIPSYLKALQTGEKLVIDLDDTYGCAPGFLEEIFGGMVRLGYANILDNIILISHDDPNLIEEIINYMKEEKERRRKK